MSSLSDLQELLKEAAVDVRNDSDDMTYTWVPISRIHEILADHDAVVKAFQDENFEIGREMKSFMFDKAKTLVAVLIRRGRHKWLSFFHGGSFDNKCFPINFESVKIDKSCQKWTVASYKSNQSIKSVSFKVTANEVDGISKKDDDELANFCKQYQWEFFVPVFAPNEPAHVFDPRCPMPFVKEFEPYATNFSIVRHFVIHRSHLNFPRDDQIGTIVDAEDNPHVAVKELLSAQGLTADKFQDLAENEATILARLRNQNHPHFIRAIASFTQGNRHFFVFPWARGGNLRNFWKLQPSLSAASDDISIQDWNNYLYWFFEQLLGLASAVKNLHHPENDQHKYCRHGDLKPENILCFSKKEDDIGKGKIPTGVRLVVADAGHAKVHEEATEIRGSPTTTPKGTIMYSPPEADIKQARTRRYDIWSIGCLYLESLIWMMYGYDALKSFHLDVGPGEPYFVKGPPAELKVVVKEWIKTIKDDPRCAPVEKTAVGRLISLIEERMLVVRVTRRDIGNQQPTSLNVIVRRPTQPLDSDASARENPERADAKEVYEKMKSIFDAGEQNDLIWMIRDAKASARGPPTITRGLAPGDSRRPPRTRESLENITEISDLDDVWTYNTDNATAVAIIPDSVEKRAKLEDSILCSRCQDLRIWSEACKFEDTLAGLELSSTSCELCRLLHLAMSRRAARRGERITFTRTGSDLTFEKRHWDPILTLCRSADSQALKRNGVKLGIPFSLVPGDKTHASILAEWIKSCDRAHHFSVGETFIPNRLLLVGDSNSTCVQLVSNLAKDALPVVYVALSHRWGTASNVEDKFTTTTTENIRLIEAPEGVEDVSLPKTFQDAVIITRQLGVKYLWIDSLCILQSRGPEHDSASKADWERESELMEEIFGSAYVTIAASCASHRFEGFLKPRVDRKFVTMRAEDGAQFHVCENIDKFETDVEEGDLNQRGWVLQERALSRRTLHFTSSQTYWECGEGIRCETFAKTFNRKAAFLGDSNFPHSVESFKQGRQLQHYHDLYERYSSLGLSYLTDKPRAIAGLEKRLMTALKSIGGYGVFQSNFHRDLLWQRRNNGKTLRRINFPPEERIPSWSWMAFDGEISYMNVALGDLERTEGISSPFQRSSQAISHTTLHASEKAYLQAPVRTLMRDNPAGMILDEPNRVLPRPLMCVIVGSNKQHRGRPLRHYALIVTPVEGLEEEKVVERVGVAYLSVKDVSIEDDAEFVNVQ